MRERERGRTIKELRDEEREEKKREERHSSAALVIRRNSSETDARIMFFYYYLFLFFTTFLPLSLIYSFFVTFQMMQTKVKREREREDGEIDRE